MGDLAEGESVEMKGSAAKPYILKNDGGRLLVHLPGVAQPVAAHRSADLQAPAQAAGGRRPKTSASAANATSARAATATSASATAPPVMLAERWAPSQDPTGVVDSRKSSTGCARTWDGAQFLSRNGNRYVAPDWFVAGLPDQPLDGELWGGRKQFQDTVSVVRSVSAGERWRSLKYLIFDAPTAAGGLRGPDRPPPRTLTSGAPYAEVLDQQRCEGTESLRKHPSRRSRRRGPRA